MEQTKDILLTIPVKLEKTVREDAKRNRRSRQSHLIWILEQYYTQESASQKALAQNRSEAAA